MRTAALYDIHGNVPALEAVLADVERQGVDLIIIGGDVVPGPMPAEALALLGRLTTPSRFIRGNGDRVVLAQRAGADISEVPEPFRPVIRWTASQVDDATAAWMSTWPLTTRVGIEGIGDVLFCHASPRNDLDIFTKATPVDVVEPLFASAGAPVVVCGHTHMQFDRMIGPTRVVNAGSVGMPFQEPGAYWLLIAADVELRRTEYDLARAAERVRQTSYPQAEEFAARNILTSPSESTMLEAFGGGRRA
jgi:putative phosphoesterase